MKIYLIRHGRTEWNDLGKWQGNTDISLDDIGIEQAERLSKRMAKLHFRTVYASDLIRAKHTAQIIAKPKNLDVIDMKSLREVNLGFWEGKTIDEISQFEGFDEWEINAELAPHGGESFKEVYDRIAVAINKIVENNDDDIVIVSHGASIRLFLCYILCIPISERMRITVDNAALTTINYNKQKKRYTVITLNDKSHLE